MSRNHSRRTMLVDARTQSRIILQSALPMIGCLLLAIAAEMTWEWAVANERVAADATIFGMPSHRLGMLILFVSAATWQLASALLISQRVAGTAYRIRRTVREFLGGDAEARVRLRQGDYQLGLQDDVNSLLDQLATERSGSASSGASAATPSATRPASDRPSPTKNPSQTS